MTVQATSGPGAPAPVDTVTVTIDGFEIAVPKGTLVIRAAELLGIQIPRFCDHPLLDPIGACRQCLVDVEGQRKPLASCTTVCTGGMVVRTQLSSPVAEKAQRGVMELLLVNHPLDCPMCDKGGECPLQNQAMSTGQGETRFTEEKRTFDKPVAISSEVLLDRERCISCTRCTRFSEEIAGDAFIEFVERGPNQMIGTAHGDPFNSYFSGNTVQICPVGALTGAPYRFRSRPFDLVSTSGVCEHCASGCRQRTDHRRGRVMRRLAADDPAGQRGMELRQGPVGVHLRHRARPAHHPAGPQRGRRAGARVLAGGDPGRGARPGRRPPARHPGRPASRGPARRGRADRGPAHAGRRLRLRQVRPRRARHQRHRHAGPAALGRGGRVPGRVRRRAGHRGQLRRPGARPGRAAGRLRAGGRVAHRLPAAAQGGPQVRADASTRWRRSPAAGWPSCPACCSPPCPGDEARALARLGGDAGTARRSPSSGRGSAAAAEAATWKAAAEALAAPGAIILVGERLAETPGALSAVARLAETTGARLAWIPRRAGERGAIEAGAMPGLLPVGRPVTDTDARMEVARAWGVASLPSEPGRDTAGILAAAAAGELGALVVAGVDPADLPDPAAALDALAMTPFIVSLELRVSAVTDRADVVLPVAAVAEKAGTFVNWEGRGGTFGPALQVPGIRSDLYALGEIADEMDVHLGLPDAEAARAEIARIGTWRGAQGDRSGRAGRRADGRRWPVRPTLATWHLLLDAGRMQDGEPYLGRDGPGGQRPDVTGDRGGGRGVRRR